MLKLEDMTEQMPLDIFRDGVDEQRRISGRVKMAWPPKKKIEVIAVVQSSPSDKNPDTFRIFFELGENYLEILDLAPHDEFHLSLKGATLDRLENPPKLATLAMQLVFSKGVYIQWKHHGEWKTLNTWPSNDLEDVAKMDNWFLSQDKQATNPEPQRLKRNHDGEKETGNGDSLQGSLNSSKESKKRRKMEAKARKREATSNIESTGPPLTTGQVNDNHSSTYALLKKNPSKSDESLAIEHCSNQPVDSQTPVRTADSSASSHGAAHEAEFKAGLHSRSFVSPPLNDIIEKQITSLIGIVVDQSTPKRTSVGDWMRFVHLVDPSNYSTYSSGLKINCFTKNHEAWLPHPEMGDVLILRNVKIQGYQGHLMGVGYKDKLSWAAFSPTQGEFHHGPPNKAPREEGLAEGGLGVPFSPFFQPGSAETRYCIELSDWWRKTTTEDPSEKVIIQKFERYQRVHRLISEAGPSVPPDGYFNCTVEVLKVFSSNNLNTVCTVYLTDYTRNEQTMAVQSNWCHPLLSELVVQFEMWDEAAEIAATMQPGQYYSINNARMKTSTAGYLEGKVVQSKMVKLSEDARDIHLQALLERKRKFQAKKATSESRSNYQLIQDIKENMFFHCTVELLHVELSTNGRACLYVTDYTSNPSLANSREQPALQTLNGRVVKILLIEEQRQIAEVVEPGSLYCIRHLRLRESPLEGFCGTLGGTDTLVVKLNPNKTDNEHLNGLLRRREEWQRSNRQHTDIKDCVLRNDFQRIQDIFLMAECSGSQCIRARPIDFYPLDLQDAFYQRCSQCNNEIPKTAKACFKCGDFEHQHVQYFYQLYILVEDEEGQQLMISIDDKCSLLNGIKRECLHENPPSLEQLRGRLEPIIGNLIMVHNALKVGKCIEVKTSEFFFNLQSWLIPSDKKAFRLIECKPLISQFDNLLTL